MLTYLKHIDTQVFLAINGKHNHFFDFVMYWISNKWIWIPFYALLAYLLIREYKWKSTYIFIAVGLLTALTDQCADLFKSSFQRLRPCHNPQIMDLVHLVHNHCGGAYGFVSSHASNVFGLAFILTFFLRKRYTYFPLLIFSWAAIIAYSRVYLGVHFPGDVTGGTLLGLLLAFIVTRPFRYIKTLQFYKS